MTRQPSAFRISRWPSVSTPSATTGRCMAWHRPNNADTTSLLPASDSSAEMKLRSILTQSIGRCRRWFRLE